MITASGKPQKAVDAMVASWALFNSNSTPNRDKIPALIPKEREVTSNARQLATKS